MFSDLPNKQLQWGPQKHEFGARPTEPTDPADSRHGGWCTTPRTLAPEVRMTVVLNKLPQIRVLKLYTVMTFT